MKRRRKSLTEAETAKGRLLYTTVIISFLHAPASDGTGNGESDGAKKKEMMTGMKCLIFSLRLRKSEGRGPDERGTDKGQMSSVCTPWVTAIGRVPSKPEERKATFAFLERHLFVRDVE